MSRVIPFLYIGSDNEAQNLAFLESKNIKLIVNTAADVPNYFPQKFEYLRLELDDTPNQNLSTVLDTTAQKIIKYIRLGKTVFVHCMAGISRSASVVIYTLMKLHDWNYDRSFKYLKALHSITNPNYGFVEQLVARNTLKNRDTMISTSPSTIETPIDIPKHEPIRTFITPKYQKIEQDDNLSENPDKKEWNKLTMDCPECDLPNYTPMRHGIYARIFS